MAAVTVYVLDTSEIIDPGCQDCVLLYSFGHPIILSRNVKFFQVSLHGSQGMLSNHLARKRLFELLRSGSTSQWT